MVYVVFYVVAVIKSTYSILLFVCFVVLLRTHNLAYGLSQLTSINAVKQSIEYIELYFIQTI